MVKHASESHAVNRRQLDFLRGEIHTGLTLSKIALETDDEEKRQRNRANARKAYDSIMHFMPRVFLADKEAHEIKVGVAELLADLQKLGEEV